MPETRSSQGERKSYLLSNWPRYPGGAIAGALIAIAAVALFLNPGLQSLTRITGVAIVLLLALRSRTPPDGQV